MPASWWRWWTIPVVSLACAAGWPFAAGAQTLATPDAHWGAMLIPEFEERTELGVHFLDFTRYGKELTPDRSRYTFTPYNDNRNTLGFNVLAYSESHEFAGNRLSRATPRVGIQPTHYRLYGYAGIINDVIPRWFQNTVIHNGRLQPDPLRPVPRDTTDTPSHVSLGKGSNVPILGFGGEYNLRLFYLAHEGGVDELVPTTFFVGGGWDVGTINEEAYVQIGAAPQRHAWNWPSRRWPVYFTTAAIGALGRSGVVLNGYHLRDLTASYVTTQVAGYLGISVGRFPAEFAVAFTSMDGFFAEPRSAAEIALASEPDHANLGDSPYALRPKHERYMSTRVRIGEFCFETYNDSFGHKDKGPTYGAQISVDLGAPIRFWHRASTPHIPAVPPPATME